MATIELTESDFEQTITGKDIVLVDYWAEWCGPCRQFAPIYEEASERHPDVVFAKVDTEAEQQIAAAAQITSIPTLMAFREGVLVFSQPGALPAQALDQIIDGVKGLDMTEVHAQVAAQRDLQSKPREVSTEEMAEARAAGAFVLDVRELDEYTAGHVAGAHHIPLQSVPGKLEELPQGQLVYVICASGGRSLQATDFLRQAGIEAYSVVGGTTAWAAQNREMETGA